MTPKPWTTSSPRWTPGLTLIEVVAALAILGTILVGIVLAQSRHAEQRVTAARKQVAVRAAERMLDTWWTDPAGVPHDGAGVVEGHPDLRWRIRLVAHDQIEALGGQVVRFTIRDTRIAAENESGWGDDAQSATLVTVDLALPAADPRDRAIDIDALNIRDFERGGAR